jgi:holo-[acyl-carrier protein] synthase
MPVIAHGVDLVDIARIEAMLSEHEALGTGWRDGISWRDIEVTRQPSGSPRLVLAGRCAELAARMNIAEWHVTLSHTPVSAMASVIGSA